MSVCSLLGGRGVPDPALEGGEGVPGLRSGEGYPVSGLRGFLVSGLGGYPVSGPRGSTRSQVSGEGGVPVPPFPVKGKNFDTRFGLIHVQTGKKIFAEGPPSPPSKEKNF